MPSTSGSRGSAQVVVPRHSGRRSHCPRCRPRSRPLSTRIPCATHGLLLKPTDATVATYKRRYDHTKHLKKCLKHLRNAEKTFENHCKHMQHPDKTLANICMKYLKTLICLQHVYICNIYIYFCNVRIKHLQHSSRTDKTLRTYT
jgi:hypothetical protein